MTTKSQLTSPDPTFETQGPMGVFLCNRTDNGGASAITTVPVSVYGMYTWPQRALLAYGPNPAQPPPPWLPGTDWKVPAGSFYSLVQDQFPVAIDTPSTNWLQGGSACVLSVSDRSTKKVAPGAQYFFDQPFLVGLGTMLSIHFAISGVAGGSTVLPGFGLWDLNTNPGAWTYLSPTAFDGAWSLQLRSDDFIEYATLSVTYVRYSTMTSGATMSRLFYSVSGCAQAKYPFNVTSSQVVDDAPQIPSGTPPEPGSSIDIIRASTAFTES